jgi:flagellar protein FlaG
MADQVNPTGNLAPGLALTFTAAVQPQTAQEKPRVAKPTTPQPGSPEGGSVDTSAKALDSAVKEFKDYLQQNQSDLSFQVDQSSGRMYFKLVDSRTKEVIRQIPSEEVLAMARKLRELANSKGASGVLVDKEG